MKWHAVDANVQIAAIGTTKPEQSGPFYPKWPKW